MRPQALIGIVLVVLGAFIVFRGHELQVKG